MTVTTLLVQILNAYTTQISQTIRPIETILLLIASLKNRTFRYTRYNLKYAWKTENELIENIDAITFYAPK